MTSKLQTNIAIISKRENIVMLHHSDKLISHSEISNKEIDCNIKTGSNFSQKYDAAVWFALSFIAMGHNGGAGQTWAKVQYDFYMIKLNEPLFDSWPLIFSYQIDSGAYYGKDSDRRNKYYADIETDINELLGN